MSITPGMVSGAVFAVSCFLLADAVAAAHKEVLPSDRLDFTYYLPAIFSILGFFSIAFTTPKGVSATGGRQDPKEVGFFVAGWVILFSSTIGALVICGLSYVGPTTKASSFPGIAMVMYTCFVALSSVAFWAGKTPPIAETAGESW
jgi:hypothetical protein